MYNKLKLVICIVILFILYSLLYIEKYTSERSQWEDSQQGEDTRTNWEKIGISEEEYNNVQSEWNSLIDIKNSGVDASERVSNEHVAGFIQGYNDAESNWGGQDAPLSEEEWTERYGESTGPGDDNDPFAAWRDQNHEYMTEEDAEAHFTDVNSTLRTFCVSTNDDEWNNSLSDNTI
tara:strand:- start:459 stop:989 length:531 start_codon:yes stop_codon:yes gene_type:complete